MTDVEKAWERLKERCCADPKEAKRCVIVSKADFVAALSEIDPAQNLWRDTLIDELTTWCIYDPAKHDNNPRQALLDLIAWERKVALDPKVSEGAVALVQAGIDAAAYAMVVRAAPVRELALDPKQYSDARVSALMAFEQGESDIRALSASDVYERMK